MYMSISCHFIFQSHIFYYVNLKGVIEFIKEIDVVFYIPIINTNKIRHFVVIINKIWYSIKENISLLEKVDIKMGVL
ncbi:hypothetical protein EEL30_00505 (plasmid) [Brevibacillus laterosporus]|uniref:Uncharacterized protein n=1 Tax=Brevibacillus laterosporus TaxID=1465 RepID=A0A518V1X6_BRELA|nr:hypothetical protein EEL30_00505 [Brevibacillus laterosporus]